MISLILILLAGLFIILSFISDTLDGQARKGRTVVLFYIACVLTLVAAICSIIVHI